MMQNVIQQTLKTTVQRAFPAVTIPGFDVTHPDREEHGDYSANIALVLAKAIKKPPLEVADLLVRELPQADWLERTEVARPGFINFYLKTQFFLDELGRIIELSDQYGKAVKSSKDTILFEYGQPNTHKVPHIGHLFSYCYGESCVRLLEFTGHKVYRANYQGDVGLHVAKCLWAYERKLKADEMTLEEKVNLLQECYQEGSAAYEEDEEAKQEIDELNRVIYLKDPTVTSDWEKTRGWSITYYKEFEKRIGVHYDRYYYESETSEVGTALVEKYAGDIFQYDQGAVIFRGERYGLHTRVFINRLGNPTYEAKDIGLMAKKQEDFKVDQYVITTANEQNEYWRVVKKAIELIWPRLEGRVLHIGYGMINLTTGKMSSRTGNIMTAFSLVETVKERVGEFIDENRDYTAKEAEEIAETVAIGAIKYSFLKVSPSKNISFNLEASIDFNGNSGPYLQYTYARCMSVLAKAKQSITLSLPRRGPLGVEGPTKHLGELKMTLNAEELSLLRWLYRFPDVVEKSAAEYAPHHLAGYLFELAQRYSLFYDKHKIITEDMHITQFRLLLTHATAQLLRNGLNLLGINVSDRV